MIRIPHVWVFALALVMACGESGPERERCAQCGMFVDLAPQWMAERRGEDIERYDTPKCALRAGGTSRLHLREYYSQEFRATDDLVFVAGSDVIGPMGDDLVPLDPAQLEHFIEDHGGRAVQPSQVDAELLGSLDR